MGSRGLGVNFLCSPSSQWASLSQVACLQEKEPFVGTKAPGTQFQLLLISSSISDPSEDEAFEVRVFSRLLIVCALLGEIASRQDSPATSQCRGNPKGSAE